MNILRNINIFRILISGVFAVVFGIMLFTASDMPSQEVSENLLTSYKCTLLLLIMGGITAQYGWIYLRINKIDILIFALAIVVAFDAAIRQDIGPKYDEFAASIILYIALRWTFQSLPQLKDIVLIIIFILAIYEGWIGIGQALGVRVSNHGLFCITGTLFNPGPYGGLLATIGACSSAYIIIHYGFVKEITRKSVRLIFATQNLAVKLFIYALACITTIFCIIILPATFSRAAWISMMLPLMLGCLKEFKVKAYVQKFLEQHRLRKTTIGIAFISIIVALGVWSYKIKQDSADGRLLIWKIDTHIIKDSPWGVGLGKFAGAYGQTQAKYFANNNHSETERIVAGCPENGFNEYLQFGAEVGWVGMVLLILIVVLSIKNSIKNRDATGYAFFAMALFAMFSYPLSVLPLRILFIVLLACSASQVTTTPYVSVISFKRKYILYTTILVITMIPLFTRGYRYISAQKQWADTSIWQTSERYDYFVEDGEKLYDIMKYDYKFLYDYGYALHKQGEYVKSIEVLTNGTLYSSDPMFYNILGKNYQALGDWDIAESCFQHAHNMIPSRIYPLYLMTRLQVESKQYNKALTTASKALTMKIKVESEQALALKQELQEIINTYSD